MYLISLFIVVLILAERVFVLAIKRLFSTLANTRFELHCNLF